MRTQDHGLITGMNENEPNFKVTDRRLFNADGSPRELPEQEKPEQKATAPEPAATFRESPAGESPAAESQAPQSETEPVAEAFAASPEEHEMPDAELTEEELADARDPASFISFVMSIASNAASALGMMEHPVTHQREVDPELGKHWIDVLGMLKKKTEGNLTRSEQNMIEGLLHDLRMQYVALTSAPQKARSFSGRDITGG
jgi:uncharacterized protein DUF1844